MVLTDQILPVPLKTAVMMMMVRLVKLLKKRELMMEIVLGHCLVINLKPLTRR